MGKKRILLVDDEIQFTEMMKVQLEESGYEVITAYEGQEGLEKARKEEIDLIILDLMLPRMDGYKVCALLKADSRYNKIPIILLSARAQAQDKAMGEQVKAEVYITKPFRLQELLEKIQELLGR